MDLVRFDSNSCQRRSASARARSWATPLGKKRPRSVLLRVGECVREVGANALVDCVVQSRFEELTQLSIAIQNDIDQLLAPLSALANRNNSNGTGAATAVPELPSFAATQTTQQNIRRRLRTLHDRMTALQASSREQDSNSDKQFVLDRLTKHLTIAEE